MNSSAAGCAPWRTQAGWTALSAIAIDGKWLRGVADGQVKLFAAMLQEEKVMIAQHRIPDETTETTQVKALLDIVDLENAVVTADAAHAQRETADYIAGKIEDGGRDSDYAVTVKGNQPGWQRDISGKVTADCGTGPGHIEIDYSHGRIVKRSIWVTDAEGIDFPHADQVYRIPPRHLRPRRHRPDQGNRARYHQPRRGTRHPRRSRAYHPRAMGY